MADELFESVHRLVREAYRPFESAAELVSSFADVALTATHSLRARVSLRDLLDTPGGLRVIRGLERGAGSGETCFPILYQDVELGGLSLLPQKQGPQSQSAEVGRMIAKILAYHLKRHEVGRLARERYHQELALVGTSLALQRIDQFVERASKSFLPALILGERGAEMERVALALHLAGPKREGPFVRINCAALARTTFEQLLTGRVLAADGGTLLLCRLEELERPCQHLLCEILERGIESWAEEQSGREIRPRLVATATRDIEGWAEEGRFYKGLLDQLDYLRLEVEPLKKRQEDLKPLIEYYLQVHAGGDARISDSALQACASYPWPGNVSELSRMVARLVVMSEDGFIRLRHLAGHAPHLLEAGVGSGPGEIDRLVEPPRPETLASAAIQHPALQRAIDYIISHYQERLSLSEVAACAYVSVSHLEHLFHRELGTTFTRFLTAYRIRRAKRLLLEQPHSSVTTIAGEAGFSDLRHFERVFKSLVGCTPKIYRKTSPS